MNDFKSRIADALLNDAWSGALALQVFRGGQLQQQVSYQQLHRDVEQVCATLVRMGVNSRSTVGILAPNSYEWIVTDLALILLGAVCVAFPVDFASRGCGPLAAEFQLDVLMRSRLLPVEDDDAVVSLYLEDMLRQPAVTQCPAPAERIVDYSVSTLVFGSGTEGKIKCIKANFSNALPDFEVIKNKLAVDGDDNLLLFLPLSVLQQRIMVYIALLNGASISLVQPDELLDALPRLNPTLFVAPPLLFESVAFRFEEALNNIRWPLGPLVRRWHRHQQRPAVQEWLLQALVYRKLRRVFGSRMRMMLVGMAMVKRSTLELFASAGLPLYEAYGLSETGVIALNTPQKRRLGSVGQPIVPGAVYLAEDTEIIVRRERLWTTGFTNVSEEEARKSYLTENEFATGDFGRFDEDGFLYIVGRKKQTLSLSSGYKVQPETVESVINCLDGVKTSVAFGTGLPFIVLVVSIAHDLPAAKIQAIRDGIEAYNGSVVTRARIGGSIFTHTVFTRENEFLNRNLKLNRDKVWLAFVAEIETLVDTSNCSFAV